MNDGEDDEYYTVPIRDQRVFGAGIKRKRIAFVRGTSAPATISTANATSTDTGPTLAEQYLKQYKEKAISSQATPESCATPEDAASPDTETPPPVICEICQTPIRVGAGTLPHEATITHQLAIQHSHGPSAINRTSKGLPYMEARGWDPDERKGLGATGSGMLYPIEVQEKKNRFGLGVKYRAKADGKLVAEVKKATNLTARQIRNLDDEERRRGEKLRDLFYRDEKVDKMLGKLEDQTVRKKKSRRREGVNGFEDFAPARR